MLKLITLTFAALALSACAGGASTLRADMPSAPVEDVSAQAIEAHIRFLADDAMQGRDAGTRGYELAANYVEAQYRAIGLAPGGEDGYRAPVPLQTMSAVADAAAFEIDGEALTPGEDFIVFPSAVHDESDITAPAVFVGRGIVAPGLGLDAYEGVDVAGKIVVALAGAPDGLPSDVAAHLGSTRTRAAFAAEAGAPGFILIPAEGLTRWNYERLAAYAVRPSMTTAAADTGAGLKVQAAVSTPTARALFAAAPQSFDAVLEAALNGEPMASFALNTQVRLAQATTRERLVDDNVVGLLAGTDPDLSDELIVVTAHLDHIGVCRMDEAEDQICNGALDNASGVAIMIETARALAQTGGARRPVAFVALAAEERGLLGSAHIAQNPPPAWPAMAANINLDMPVIRYRFNDLVAFGAEHSTLGEAAQTAVSQRGLTLTPDPLPEQALFVRSDHYNFVREGVPSLFLMTGFSSPDPEDDEGQGFLRFLGGDYHAPGDEVDQVLFDQGARFAELNLAIINAVANDDATPRWRADSFFNP